MPLVNFLLLMGPEKLNPQALGKEMTLEIWKHEIVFLLLSSIFWGLLTVDAIAWMFFSLPLHNGILGLLLGLKG